MNISLLKEAFIYLFYISAFNINGLPYIRDEDFLFGPRYFSDLQSLNYIVTDSQNSLHCNVPL